MSHHHHHHISRPRGNTSSSTTSSLALDDLDAITPCPPHSHPNALLDSDEPQAHKPQHSQRRPSPSLPRKQRPTSWRSTLSLTPSSSSSTSSSEEQDTTTTTTSTTPGATEPDAPGPDPETLWRRMLALQRTLGCYNSARMRAALEQRDPVEGGVPSRTCLDLLNDSIGTLPEEERRRVEDFLHMDMETGGGKKRGDGWRGRWLGLGGRAGR